MTPLKREDRLREAIVVLSDDEMKAWTEVIARSGRLKVSRVDLLARARLAFGVDDKAAADSLRTGLPDTAPKVGRQAHKLVAVLAGCQLVELFATRAKRPTELEHVDAAALGVRILARTTQQAVVPDLVAYANQWLAFRGDSVRRLAPTVSIGIDPPHDLADTDSAATDAIELDELRAAHNKLVRQVTELGINAGREYEKIADALDAWTRRLAQAYDLLAEQQQIGWWLLSAAQTDQLDWSSAYEAAVALSGLTRELPGPRAAHELLRRKFGMADTWDPTPLVLEIPDEIGTPHFTPALDQLRGSPSSLSEPATVSDAALAVYDELLLQRLAKS